MTDRTALLFAKVSLANANIAKLQAYKCDEPDRFVEHSDSIESAIAEFEASEPKAKEEFEPLSKCEAGGIEVS